MITSESPRRGRLGLFLFAALLALCAVPAFAQTGAERRRANELYRRANARYEKGDFHGALELLQRAHATYPSAKTELSIGYALEQVGQLPQAAECFERFRLTPEAKADPARAAEVEAKLRRLRSRLATITLSCTVKDAVVSVDGERVTLTPLAFDLYLVPGSHRLTVTSGRRTLFDKQLALKAGEHYWHLVQPLGEPGSSGRATVAPQRIGAPPPVVARSRTDRPNPVYKRWWFWVMIGGAVATGAVLGAVLPNVGGSDRLPTQDLGTIDMRQ